MIETPELIAALAAAPAKVRRLHAPVLRACAWLGLAAVLVAVLALEHGLRPDLAAQLRKPHFAISLAASLLTGVCAVIACLQASLPDRSRAWLLLPLPPLALWLSGLGYGCLTDWVMMEPNMEDPGETLRCLTTVAVTSLPLGLALLVLLRHAERLRPTLLTLTAGLAVAAIATLALSLLHSIDATAMVLLFNLGTVTLILAIEWIWGRSALAWLSRRTV